jgi:L-asparaginase II
MGDLNTIEERITSDEAVAEAYEIVRTVQVHLRSKRTFLLEVRRMLKGANVEPFHVMAYERMTLYRNSNGTITSKSGSGGVSFHVWIDDLNLATFTDHRSTPEAALSVALARLSQHRDNENTPW